MAKDPRLTAIEAQADRASRDPNSPGGAKSTPKERKGIRNTLRARQGLGYEEKVKGGVAGVFDRNQFLAPLLAAASAFIPGAPALLPAIIGGAGKAIGSGDPRDLLSGGLQGAAAGGLGQMAAGALGGAPTAPMAVGDLGNAAPDFVPPAAGGPPVGMIPQETPGLFERGKDFLTGNGGRNALGVASTLNNAYQQMQARQMANRAVRGQEAEWKANAPMRVAGRQRLTQGVPGNPFAAPMGVGAP